MKFYLSKVQLLHTGMPGDYEPEAGTPNVRVTVYGEHGESITNHMFIEDAKNRALVDIEKEVNQYFNGLYSASVE
ncbi:hypothetical protein UXN72_08430 [Enterobacter hormaechei]|uniref:hypothetical protein n=1 Tax=Enterobacter hormaechei TaxID=158836 RepID=UPI00079698B0|nr:hypothetical protein [Enterobacter hormaechei]HBM2626375.1 hypothetical protein [Enterobacter hormaechei subsp. hoffmannii]MCE1374080.1 hypothetical protein [Enterobacter hormaechei]MCM7790575.1 hypothetical protein [Enterobacter hormaechei]WGZ51325.1 hypothetical protein MOG78_07330 [Enterobacter hormaechei]CZX68650.1 Uncharacterised protein [Enterobacter hormaechei]